MSVDYDLFCKKHNERVGICSDGLSGPLLQCDRSLAAFIITHATCKLVVLEEGSDRHEDATEWDESNWEKLLRYGLI